ncbi:MAG: type II secretion system major pseudopilin GspG [Fimbriimonadaceae bacterium]
MNVNPRTKSIARKGFTLIELLVVMLILAILAAMIVPRLISRADEAKVARSKSDLVNIRKSLDVYYLDTGVYPTAQEGLEALRTPPSGVTGWKGPYFLKPITGDGWGNPYVYDWPGPDGDASYVLMSYGSDGQPGGSDNATDIIESGE